MNQRRKILSVGITALLMATACATSSNPPGGGDEEEAEPELGISDEDYSIDALVDAAQDEDGIVVVDSTGKIVEIAEEFSEEYGLDATGVSLSANEQTEVAVREGQSGNINHDVFLMPDTPTAVTELLPQEVVVSWFPPDLVDNVDSEFQDPAIVTQETFVWAYNTDVYGDECPVSNFWELTDEEWSGLVAYQDPLMTTRQPYSFNQKEYQGDDLLAGAYLDYYGEELGADAESATAEWVEGLAQNDVLLTNSNGDISDAIGAPGQDDPFIGFLSTAKFRDNIDLNYNLGICEGLFPWVGWAYTKTALIASDTESPNTAKLFVRYMYSEEGIEEQAIDGKISTNTEVPFPEDDPSRLEEVWDDILIFESAQAQVDYDRIQYWQDLWRSAR